MDRNPDRTRWCVRVELSEGDGWGVLSVGNPGRTSWLTKSTAEKHAEDYRNEYGLGAYVEEG